MTNPPPPAEPTGAAAPPPQKPRNQVAVVALIIAVVAFVAGLIPFVGFISWLIAVAAVVVAIVALTRAGLPKGMAVFGLIVGVLALIVGPSVAVASLIGAVSNASSKSAIVTSTPADSVPKTEPTSAVPGQTETEPAPSPTPEASSAAPPVLAKVYRGVGDKVLHVDYDKPIVVKFVCSPCSGNTSVTTDSSTDTLPVNEIGSYRGRFLLNAQDGDLLTKFVIKATGRWIVKIQTPVDAGLKHVTKGGTLDGKGDDVILVEEGVSDSDVRNVGQGNFVLQSYGGSDSLPVNEIGSYKGNVELDGPAVVQVKSDGHWTIKGNG